MSPVKLAPWKKTPDWARAMFRIFFLISTVFASAMQTLPEGTISTETSNTINSWVIWLNGLMWLLSRSFGVDTETTVSVTESVTQSVKHETTIGTDEKELPAKPETK